MSEAEADLLTGHPRRGPELHRTSPKEFLRAHAWQVLGAGAGVALFVGRGWSRVEAPGIWAEDGTRFLPDALAHGLGSLFMPFQGYVHVIPRIAALFLSPFPLATLPRLYTLAAILISLLAFAPVLSKRIEWLIPSPAARAAAFVLLCALPALSEVYGNLANLIFVCGVGSLLIGLSADPVRPCMVPSAPGRLAHNRPSMINGGMREGFGFASRAPRRSAPRLGWQVGYHVLHE